MVHNLILLFDFKGSPYLASQLGAFGVHMRDLTKVVIDLGAVFTPSGGII